jgi:hypothetical protein
MTAFGIQVAMKAKSFYSNPFSALSAILALQEEGENFLADIKESKYKKVDVKDVIDKQNTFNRCTAYQFVLSICQTH